VANGFRSLLAIRNHVFVAIERGQQSRRGLGDTDGFAFVPQTIAVFSLRQPLGVGAERSPQSIKWEDSQADDRIIFAEFGRLRPAT
jgi:hypothetical protein